MAVLAREHRGRLAVDGRERRIRAAREQQVEQGESRVGGGPHQRRVVLLLARVDVGPRVDQPRHDLRLIGGDRGVNRLHDAIYALNDKEPFKFSKSGQVELLSSKFSQEHRSYVVEIRVPFQTHTGEYASERKVPQSFLVELFDAVNEFQPQLSS